MAEYRYIFADLLSNEVSLELPLYGVNLSRALNKAGNAGFSFALNEDFDDADVIEGTAPGRTVLYVERNGALAWGGIIWSRTWQEQSLSFQYTAQTFESFLHKQPLVQTFIRDETDQRNILRDLVNQMQADQYANIGITVPQAFPNDITRSITFYDYELWTYGKAIDSIVSYSDGFDYTIDVQYDGAGEIQKVLKTDNELGTPLEATQLVFDYPGNVKNFWYPENASRGATSAIGAGSGSGWAMSRTPLLLNQTLLNHGYPNLTEYYSNKDIADIDNLTNQTVAYLNQKKVPISVPTYETNPEEEPVFGSYALGDYVKIEIESRRFPGGKTLAARIVGWDIKPTSSEGQEQVRLVVSGEEEGEA